MDPGRDVALCQLSETDQRPWTPPREPFYTWLTPLQYKCDNLQGEKRAGQDRATQGCLNPGTLTISRDPEMLGIWVTTQDEDHRLREGK